MGALALLRHGSDALMRHVGADHGVDINGLVESCARLAEAIDRAAWLWRQPPISSCACADNYS